MSYNKIRSSTVTGALLTAALMVAGCDATDQGDNPLDGSVRGEFLVYSINKADGHSDTQFFLRTADNVEHPLFFDVEPDLAPGTQIKVWGPRQEEGYRVTHMQPLDPPDFGSVSTPLINGTKYPPRTFAFVLVDTGGGVNITKDEVVNRMLTNPGSVRSYYQYASYGRQDISVEVFGPFNYAITGCNTSKMTSDLRAMIPGQFQHYLWYLGSRNASCGWAGLASVGTPDRPSRDTWYNASSECVVLVQEPGHNFGMAHSSSMTCGMQTFVDNPNGTCRHSEYGDRFDPMGGGCRHMNAWQKAYQGWYGPCNGVKVGQSGTFTLLSQGKACNGAQFLQIPAPKVRMMPRSGGGGMASVDSLSHYYVEFRGPDNFDGTLGWRNQAQTTLPPQVHVRIGGDLRGRTQRGLHTWLLDMAPTTPSNTDAALTVGKTYTDPAGGLSITVVSVDANQASIKVEMMGAGMNTCVDGTPFQAPGPGPESCSAITPPGGDGGVSDAGPPPPPPPPKDAGTDTTTPPLPGSGGASGSGGGSGSGGATVPPGTGGATPAADGGAMPPSVNGEPLQSGCACRTANGNERPALLVILSLAAGLMLSRRRKR